ncbi:MAG TPA: phosphoribosylformylglycinamidine synthase II, partial [Rubrobacteraceae bacterium]|nr:phosphoribosylformylglycinamidine synthase II [Rubrobacteraceae bacterium]
EMAVAGGIGAEVQLLPGGRQDVALFGETGGCILVAVPEGRIGELEEALSGVPHSRVGSTGGGRLKVAGVLDAGVDDMSAAYERDLFDVPVVPEEIG